MPAETLNILVPMAGRGQRFVQAGEQAGYPHNTDFNGPTQEGVGLYQVTQRAGERFSAAKAYLTPHLNRPNLHVMTGVTVDRVGLMDGVARLVHIVQNGARRTLTARREIILSAGAFQSPAILMRSGIGPAAHLQSLGIAVLRDLPGLAELARQLEAWEYQPIVTVYLQYAADVRLPRPMTGPM